VLYVRPGVTSFDGRSRRLVGIGGVVLVHLLLIGFIVSGLPKFRSVPGAMREMILVLAPTPQPQEKPQPRDATTTSGSHPAIRLPFDSPQAIAPGVPAAKTLRVPLFDCAPEKFNSLSPEEQARCSGIGSIAPPDEAVVGLRSHVREPARRAAELASRKAPARVDCTRTETKVIQNILQQHSIIVDPLCATGALLRAMRR
jgi:hypothetical protein